MAFPTALRFVLEMAQRGHLAPFISAEKYFNLFSTVMIVLGIVFEIPPVVFILSRIGLVSGPFLLRNTRWAIMISTIVAAVVTPTTDAFNVLVVAVPLVLLYLIGVSSRLLSGGSAGGRNRRIASGIQGGAHGLKYRLVAGESDPTLTCDEFVSDPDGKFTGLTANRFNVDTQFLFEQRRYPSSAGWI